MKVLPPISRASNSILLHQSGATQFAQGRDSKMQNRRRFIHACLPLLVAGLPMSVRAQNPKNFIIGTDEAADTFVGIWMRAIYTELFRRLGVPLEIVVAPLKRVTHMLRQGQIDGEMARGPSYALQNPDFVEVNASFFHTVFSLYALKPMPELQSVADLRKGDYRAVHRLGVLFCEESLQNLMPADHVTRANHTEQSIAMVAAGRANFFCDTTSAVWNEEYSQPFPGKKKTYKVLDLGPPVPLKPFLHPKHRGFALQMAEVIKQMERERQIEKFRLDAIKQSMQITRKR